MTEDSNSTTYGPSQRLYPKDIFTRDQILVRDTGRGIVVDATTVAAGEHDRQWATVLRVELIRGSRSSFYDIDIELADGEVIRAGGPANSKRIVRKPVQS